MITTTDAFLWYNVGDWGPHGLAVPNPSDDYQSQNSVIRELVEGIGRNLQGVMFHADMRSRVPPSINTIMRIHKLIVRARDLLAARSRPANDPSPEVKHAVPAPEQFRVYPVPYFCVRNGWLKSYCGFILTALTEAMQHTENATRILDVSQDFAGLIGQYLQIVYQRIAIELLQVSPEVARVPTFTLTEEHFKGYNPAKWFTQTEMIDTVPNVEEWPTEDVLYVLTNGIPVGELPALGRWPSNPMSVGASASTAAIGGGSSFAPAPSP